MCSKFKSKSKQILEVGTCAFSNLRKFTISLNTNPDPSEQNLQVLPSPESPPSGHELQDGWNPARPPEPYP